MNRDYTSDVAMMGQAKAAGSLVSGTIRSLTVGESIDAQIHQLEERIVQLRGIREKLAEGRFLEIPANELRSIL